MAEPVLSGKYAITKELGRGGMGVVYKAEHTALKRTVAIKVLHPQYGGEPAFLKRFEREARAMARLDHRNIIRVYDVAEEKGSHYIVMEFFPGRDLKHMILEEGRLPLAKALSIALQLSEALAYAHAQGIVHRDIKPGNIMVDDQGVVKIADFGIAAATDEVSLTATGQVMGTPEYMSPEQARGEAVDARSDLYSLGMVIYAMLTGRTPFHGLSGMAILAKLIDEQKDVTLEFPSDIPLALQRLVASLLSRRPEGRIPDAGTLTARIRQLGERPGEGLGPEGGLGAAVSEAPALEPIETPPPIAPFGRPKASRPYALLALVAGVLVLAFAVWGYFHYRLQGERDLAGETEGVRRSIEGIKEEVLQAQAGAVSTEAPRVSPDVFKGAEDRRKTGLEAVEEADRFLEAGRYKEALAALEKAKAALVGSRDAFLHARDLASDLLKAEQERKGASLKKEASRESLRFVQALAEAVSKARKDADAVDGRRRAASIYSDAVAAAEEGNAALRQGERSFAEAKYDEAEAALDRSRTSLTRARDGLVEAQKAAKGTADAESAQELLRNGAISLQSSVRGILEKVSRARRAADEVGAPAAVPDVYGDSQDWQHKGLEKTSEGERLLNEGRYQEAKGAFTEAKTLLGYALQAFVHAREAALSVQRAKEAPAAPPVRSLPEPPFGVPMEPAHETPSGDLYGGELKPAGRLSLSVEPPDAEVFVDGRRLTQRPDRSYEVGLFLGSHNVVVRATGYEIFEKTIDIRRPERVSLAVQLKPLP